jgi:hypothetical protein
MPAQAAVDQRVRDNLTVGRSPLQRVVLHTQHLTLMNGPGYYRKFLQCGAVQPQREFARQVAAALAIIPVPESPGNRREHPLRLMLEDWRKTFTRHVHLPATIEIDVLGRKFPVGRKIPRCHGWRNPEPLHQIPPEGVT